MSRGEYHATFSKSTSFFSILVASQSLHTVITSWTLRCLQEPKTFLFLGRPGITDELDGHTFSLHKPHASPAINRVRHCLWNWYGRTTRMNDITDGLWFSTLSEKIVLNTEWRRNHGGEIKRSSNENKINKSFGSQLVLLDSLYLNL